MVYIVHNSGQDFSPAKAFGTLVTIHKGKIDKLAVRVLMERTREVLHKSEPGDWLIPSGPTILNILAASYLAYRHGEVNLLLWRKDGTYAERTINF